MQYSYCISEKWVGYKTFQACKQYCLDMGPSCFGVVYPMNSETWCYWCPNTAQAYYKTSNYWELSACMWIKVLNSFKTTLFYEKSNIVDNSLINLCQNLGYKYNYLKKKQKTKVYWFALDTKTNIKCPNYHYVLNLHRLFNTFTEKHDSLYTYYVLFL